MSANIEVNTFLSSSGVSEYHIMIHPTNLSKGFDSQFAQIIRTYEEWSRSLQKRITPVYKRYFLSDAANQQPIIEEYEGISVNGAVSMVQQPPLDGSKVSLWIWAQSDANDRGFENEMYVVRRNGYTQVFSGMMSHDEGEASWQTESILSRYESLLESLGGTIDKDCLRTWFYVNNIDANYKGMVTARRNNFKENNLTPETHYIASTGIEGRLADHKRLALLDAYCVLGLKPGQVTYLRAPEVLNATHEYGVTFERATRVEYGDRSHTFISGTASIDKHGQIVYPGDITRQLQRTLSNIDALLSKADCGFGDVMHMIVYLRDISDYVMVKSYLSTRFPEIPTMIVHAPVCRPGWLVEIECIAVTPNHQPALSAF